MMSLADLQDRIAKLKSAVASKPEHRLAGTETSSRAATLDSSRRSSQLLVKARDLRAAILTRAEISRTLLNDLTAELLDELHAVECPRLRFGGGAGEDYSAAIMINGALVAGFLAHNDSQQRDAVAAFVAAALVQNVGVRSGMGEAATWSERIRAQFEKHPLDAAAIAERQLGFPIEWARAIAEHHERLDQRGFPMRPAAASLDVRGRLLAVAEIYVNLRTPLPHGAGLAPREALKECLRQAERGEIDSHWAHGLLRFGFYEPGTAVELSTGERAMVIANQATRFDPVLAAQPIVCMLTGQGEPTLKEAKFRNLANWPEMRIVRSLDGPMDP